MATKKVVKVKKPPVKSQVAEDVSLDAYVPDKSVSKNYVGRKIHGVWDATIADIAMREKRNILLMGDTGSGKTLFGEAYASKNGLNYYSLACDVSIDPSSLFGRMQPTDTPGKFKWQDGPVTKIVRGGGVLNISEVNFMTPKIAASLYSLLDSRRCVMLLGHEGEVVHAADDLLVIADMNPQYRGTMELNAAFKNRFNFKIHWGYDPAVEERLVKFPTLRKIAAQFRESEEIVTPISTNMLMEFEEFAHHESLGYGFAVNNFMAAFDTDEQDAVSKIFDLNKTSMLQDLAYFTSRNNKKKSKGVDDDVEEIEWEQEEE